MLPYICIMGRTDSSADLWRSLIVFPTIPVPCLSVQLNRRARNAALDTYRFELAYIPYENDISWASLIVANYSYSMQLLLLQWCFDVPLTDLKGSVSVLLSGKRYPKCCTRVSEITEIVIALVAASWLILSKFHLLSLKFMWVRRWVLGMFYYYFSVNLFLKTNFSPLP